MSLTAALLLCTPNLPAAEDSAASEKLWEVLAYARNQPDPDVSAIRKQCLDLLENQHADPNTADADGHTVLWVLVGRTLQPWGGLKKWSNRELVNLLLEHHADPNRAAKDGTTPMGEAIYDQPFDVIRCLLEHGGDVNALPSAWPTPLVRRAADEGRADIVKLALEKGAELNKLDMNRHNVLRGYFMDISLYTRDADATQADREECLRLLLQHGADYRIPDRNGYSALTAVLERPVGWQLRVFVECGLDPETRMRDGKSLLNWAIEVADESLLSMLLAHGVDVNRVDGTGVNPLDAALSRLQGSLTWGEQLHDPSAPRRRMVLSLLAHGANVNQSNRAGGSLLQTVILMDDAELLEACLKAGADVNFRDNQLQTPLFKAAAGKPGWVDTLLSHGADPLARDTYGNTVLLAAAPANVERLYIAARNFDTAWLALLWLPVLGLTYWMRRRVVQQQPGLVAQVLDHQHTAAGESATAAAESASAENTNATFDRHVLPLQETLAFAQNAAELHLRLALISLLSYLCLGVACFLDPLLQSSRPVDWLAPGGIVVSTLVSLALLAIHRRWTVRIGLFLCWVSVASLCLWTFFMIRAVIDFPALRGLILLYSLHLASMLWLGWHALAVVRARNRAWRAGHHLRTRYKVGGGAGASAASDDFDTPAGWDRPSAP